MNKDTTPVPDSVMAVLKKENISGARYVWLWRYNGQVLTLEREHVPCSEAFADRDFCVIDTKTMEPVLEACANDWFSVYGHYISGGKTV